jgi:hypothetical protein
MGNPNGTSNPPVCFHDLPSGEPKVSNNCIASRDTSIDFTCRWLARKDRWEECHSVLTLVHGKGDPDSPFVLYELNDIREMVNFEARNSDASYLELFHPKMINRTHIGIFTQIVSHLRMPSFRFPATNDIYQTVVPIDWHECYDVLHHLCIRYVNHLHYKLCDIANDK